MVQTVAKSTGPQPYTVLRPIFIDGERQEIGAVVSLSRTVGAELVAANKVAPGKPAEAADDDAKADAQDAKPRPAKKTPAA